jgi:hypothetical protein
MCSEGGILRSHSLKLIRGVDVPHRESDEVRKHRKIVRRRAADKNADDIHRSGKQTILMYERWRQQDARDLKKFIPGVLLFLAVAGVYLFWSPLFGHFWDLFL